MEYRDKDFTGETLDLDGNTFSGCTFRNCTVRFHGTGGVHIAVCDFKENVNWQFLDHAATTFDFLRSCVTGTKEGGKEFVQKVFERILGAGPDP